MSAYPSLPLFTDAFLADTGHLPAQETGAYLLLLMIAWRSPECRIPDDDTKLCRWARVDARTWRRIKPNVMEFWTLDEGFWTQKRLRKEWDIVSKRAEVARSNGKHGGRPNPLKNNGGNNPTGSPPDTPKKAPNPNPRATSDEVARTSETSSEVYPKRERSRTAYPSDFEEFWREFPTDSLMSKKQAGETWRRMPGEDRAAALKSLPAFKAYCQRNGDYRPVHACRYLSQRRFEGFLATQKKVASKVFVREGTPEWEAWQRTKKTPVTDNRDLGCRGWWFPSQYPNGLAH